ncbi:P-loop containing nucleoside triphosphate hydrolase protein [Punctularia strigosozonata HHB-11173 SS5]|uniref:P-loop containing nucleoside triphosphate hydrolase protein n=1 Tax=Punctularia strigosozonata (strain HHB-11173) TaxID=741275 RepID=UPI0004417C79|nr:P-loop containing nucleoside triphosphate hydrolase protein [Punctularia strigosozonata HHB-11173 SS5]EIN07973.1 P-loop containing nucleoside triphosphate hydrolase protein [Punctularia strigosozonata HHB-11173 SS5]
MFVPTTEELVLLPCALAVLSVGSLLGYAAISLAKGQRSVEVEEQDAERRGWHEVVASRGGSRGLSMRVFRVAASAALTTYAVLTWTNSKSNLDIASVIFYVYATALAVVALVGSINWRRRADIHLALLFLAFFAFCAYRDLVPLALVDRDDPGPLAIAQLAVLCVLGIVIPLAMPGRPSPDPLKSASLWAELTWGYYDPIIWYAYKHQYLPTEKLPPLPTEETASFLVNKHAKDIDPTMLKKKRSLVRSMWAIFHRECLACIFLIVLQAGASFMAPLGLNRLLSYLEHPQEATLRPWVWIIWLGSGPALKAWLNERYNWITTVIMVRLSAIVTQVVFTHSLRIRMKADTAKKSSDNSTSSSAADGTSEVESIASSPTDGTATPTETTTAVDSESQDSPTSTTASISGATESGDGPPKSKTKSELEKEDEAARTAKQMVGKITNLVTSDVSSIWRASDFPLIILSLLQIMGAVASLYYLLGWSSLVGTAILVVSLPIPAWVAKQLMQSQKEKMKVSDRRVQDVTQTMNVIRMIKLFAWEKKSLEKLNKTREEELTWIRYNAILGLINQSINNLLPLCNIVVTLGLYTLIMKGELTASRVFTSLSLFYMMQNQMQQLSFWLPQMLNAKVAMDRLDEFLNGTTLLHPVSREETAAASVPIPRGVEQDIIGINAAHFTWDEARSAGQRHFRLKIDGLVRFERGAVNLIIGATGSGKTSLLMALLGEMYYHPLTVDSWYNLPRQGGVAYAAQETWVLNETIRENILFGSPFDENRYQKVLEQCALVHDLSLFAAGDKTEVGEKGLTLSGGQKARITLARAVYSDAQVILLDDILAALDVHTARHIVDKCLRGDIVNGRTVLLVSNNLALTSSLAKKVLRVDHHGRVIEEKSVDAAIRRDAALRAEIEKDTAHTEEIEDTLEEKAPGSDAPAGPSGKLTVAEDVAHGAVSAKSILLYLQNEGGALFWISFLLFTLGEAGVRICEPYVLGQWSNQYEIRDPSEVAAGKYLTMYSLLEVLETLVSCCGVTIWVFGAMRASRRIHALLIESILGSTFRWLDTVPVARVITRCTQDLQSIDQNIRNIYMNIAQIISSLGFKLVAVIFVIGWRGFGAGAFALALALSLGRIYMAAQRSIKREQSVARSPILSLFGAGLAGLPSIRAYGAQDKFTDKLSQRIDHYTRLTQSFYNLNRWVGIRIEAIGGLFAALVAIALVYGNVMDVGNAGYALSQVVGFSMLIMWVVRLANFAEVESNSLERIRDFLDIEHEPEKTQDGVPPAYWPASGSLRAEKLSARYGPNSPDVLHEISFDIKSGERVGVVGRTGAGKSTISLALLRAVLTSGKVFYDGIDTHTINLDALRSNITLIPQHPDLLAGTLRDNLDPYGEHDDATLNDALRCAGLFRLQQEGDPDAITLDSEVEGGGANFSHGQRQIIALARAQVRRSKLMIMDEATAAIDYETDAAIQESIRTTLSSDITIITIAHRLQTIMDSDKIMVLDSGRLAEFGSPKELLAQKRGLFYELVEKSHDKDLLYGMVKH